MTLERRKRWLVGSLIGRVGVVLYLVSLLVVIVVVVVVEVEERPVIGERARVGNGGAGCQRDRLTELGLTHAGTQPASPSTWSSLRGSQVTTKAIIHQN